MMKRGVSALRGKAGTSVKTLPVFCVIMLLALVLLPLGQTARAGAPLTAIYLNGTAGNDANDGSTAALAVLTFQRARALAAANPAITTIYVTGTVPISGDITLSGTNAMLLREASFTAGSLLSLAAGETATLFDITVDGNALQVPAAGNSLISSAGTLNIRDGAVLQNNHNGSATVRKHGGAINASAGTINMFGGLIKDNQATLGGGIYLYNTTLNLTGGTISNNRAVNGPSMNEEVIEFFNDAASGGGISIYRGSTVNLGGTAVVENNHSDEVGGGISVGSMEASLASNRLVMTGGRISGNTSGATGGGIFIQAAWVGTESSATITAGYITGNRMLGTGKTYFRFGGGGIYVNGIAHESLRNGQLFLENVLITQNEALGEGGGYAACPITKTKIYLKNGAAIYGNTAAEYEEIYIYSNDDPAEYGTHAGNPVYEISSVMLGGVPYLWKYPDGSEVPLSELSGTLTEKDASFGMYTEAVGNANTLALAHVFITGNYSATRGGGIGSNGDVTIGEVDEFTQLEISKTWLADGENPGIRPALVEVEVWRKIAGSLNAPSYVGYDRIRPDAVSGAWRLTLGGLPARDEAYNLYEYSLRERPVPGYESELSGDADTGYQLVNTYAGPDYPPVRVPLSAEKTLINGSLKAGEFVFELLDKSGKVIAQARNAADGGVAFPDRVFSRVVSDYIYTIREVKGTEAGMAYDTTVYKVKVNTRLVNGKLTADVNFEKDGTPHGGPLRFTNRRSAPATGDGTISLLGKLALASFLMLAGAFAWRSHGAKKR